MTEQELKNIENKLCYSQECCKDGFCKDTEENRCAIQLLLEAAEKQIPKKPKLFVGASRYKICPTCHLVLSGTQRELELPCKCGQKLDWEEE